ncbi:MAG: formate-dependent phosphoribosylglycinamide formyltransferase [Phycisphaerales bacterium]|nr:formate-dependent phosphoribosylglycinamide formyltransferase [Phycisphaerales bacterium]
MTAPQSPRSTSVGSDKLRRQPKILLLGSGELGKEFVICAKRMGCRVIAADRYKGAPAMQVADHFEVLDMLDGDAIKRLVKRHQPDFIVPEIEAIRTEVLLEVEAAGTTVIPSALAVHLTMNRDAIRSLAAETLGLPTARFQYAGSAAELRAVILGKGATRATGPRRTSVVTPAAIGLPCVIKPVMSSSGKGQSVVRTRADIGRAWKFALKGMRGDTQRVIVEEFIQFDYEITLLTVKQRRSAGGRTIFVRPLGHRQERGDYQESWMPCPMKPRLIKDAQRMAKLITDHIAGPEGAGLFGVEFFVKGARVIFSELSPRPHDTGMVTMISQDLSQFELHLRAVLGLPIPRITYRGPSASAVILADFESDSEPVYQGVDRALRVPGVQVRIFGKPSTRKYRRMGVALAPGKSVQEARRSARSAAALIRVLPPADAQGT